MKRYLPILSAVTLSLVNSVFVPSLKASDSDEKTTITISEPLNVRGTILPAGRYVLKLRNTGNDVVFIFNSDETRLVSTVLANHAYRQQASGKAEVTLYETVGEPATLHTWFYPGNNSGVEFLPEPHKSAGEAAPSGH